MTEHFGSSEEVSTCMYVYIVHKCTYGVEVEQIYSYVYESLRNFTVTSQNLKNYYFFI